MLSKIVRTVTNEFMPFILVFGFYIIAHGHLTPGGDHQEVKQVLRERTLSIMESTGALIFIALAFAGIGAAFFYNFLVGTPIFGRIPPTGPNPGDFWTGGVIPLMNLAVGLKVIAGLSAVVLAMAIFSSGEEVEE